MLSIERKYVLMEDSIPTSGYADGNGLDARFRGCKVTNIRLISFEVNQMLLLCRASQFMKRRPNFLSLIWEMTASAGNVCGSDFCRAL